MKKLFLGLILFSFVFAGVSLACVCYINPDDTVSWCEPADCNLKQSYCVGEGSTCGDVNGVTITCCPGLNLNCQRLVHGETKTCVKQVTCGGFEQSCCTNNVCNSGYYCSKEYYDLNGIYHKVTNTHCCAQDAYWDENLQKCQGTKNCLSLVQTTCPLYSGSTADFLKCVYKLPNPTMACCSMNIYGKTTDEWMVITIY